ncbi:MAG TPA: hypothetical protein VJ788_03125 [Gemmatimonadota bacterium]|nr:hypothetical protein [Gemmatimonadota bacterium]
MPAAGPCRGDAAPADRRSWVYCPGVGLVSEGSPDGEERNQLVDVDAP